MNIKKYFSFIKESKNPIADIDISKVGIEKKKLVIQIKRYDFFKSIIYLYTEHSTSYSHLAINKNADINRDFEIMQDEMDNKGWTLKNIKILFSKEYNDIIGYNFNEFITMSENQIGNDQSLDIYSRLCNLSGEIDYYLYRISSLVGENKKEIPLGGEVWQNANDQNDYMIKYAYGYHKTPYGKILLDQMNISVEKFRNIALKGFIDYFLDLLLPDILSTFLSGNDPYTINNIIRKREGDYFIVEDDRIMFSYFKVLNLIKSELNKDINEEDFSSVLISKLDFIDEYLNQDGIIVIYGSNLE